MNDDARRCLASVLAIVSLASMVACGARENVAGRGSPDPHSRALVLALANGIPSSNASSLSFTLAGTASLIYSVDPTRIATAVSGKTRSAAEVALTNYPEVKRAVIILRPFWRQTFPQDPATIKVTVAKP